MQLTPLRISSLTGHQGTTKTYVERITPASVNGRTEAFQQFLKLSQPVQEDALPRDGVLRAGQTYRLPYTFVVPQHLLPSSCRHKTANPKFKDAHLQLPPSLGDAEVSGFGSKLLDDLSPSMARVWYCIRARITRNRGTDHKPMPVAEGTRKIRVIPATEEQPPIDIDGTDDEYCMRKEKTIRKGLLQNKIGHLVIEAPQPSSLRLPPPDDNASDLPEATTMASIILRFDPASASAQPPRLSQLVSRLKVATFFASAPRHDYPSKSSILYDPSQGHYVDLIPLASRCMASTSWERHEPGSAPTQINARRQSAAAPPAPCPKPTKAFAPALPFYTTQVLVPINAPRNRILVPTFHSCLVSRTYILELSLSSLSAGGVGSGATLKVPLQVSSETAAPLGNESRQASAQMMSPEDAFFQPRSVAPPADGRRRSSAGGSLLGSFLGSDDAGEVQVPLPAPPPGYTHFAPRTGGVLRAEDSPWHTSPLYSLVR